MNRTQKKTTTATATATTTIKVAVVHERCVIAHPTTTTYLKRLSFGYIKHNTHTKKNNDNNKTKAEKEKTNTHKMKPKKCLEIVVKNESDLDAHQATRQICLHFGG